MELHNVTQGSAEWLALRAQYFTASEAPAMMGASSYMTRQELLAQKHTGIMREIGPEQARRFLRGHETEASFRPIAEEIIGDELYPCTGSIVVDGMRLLASFDGLTMNHKTGMEHKLRNQQIVDDILVNGEPGPAYYWQLEHQLLVSGAEKILFATSNGMAEGATYCWYMSTTERRAALIAGWKQFAEDLKAYVQPAASPVVVAEPVQALPAVLVQVSGEITVKDNFKTFETALRDFLDHRLIREPKTDQEFADLDLQIKAMKGAEEALAGAEAQMLAQVQSIDQAKKTRDMLGKLVRDNRLMAEKLLASEKDRRKGEIVAGGVAEFSKHMAALNERLGKPYMPVVPTDFGGAVKGLKSMSSMENAVATELARAKIEANAVADRIQVNLTWLRENAKDYAGLFADTATLVLKAHDDFVAQAQLRISTEKARVQAAQDNIREESEAKARQDLLNEQAAAAAKTTIATAATKPVDTSAPAPTLHEVLTAVAPVAIQRAMGVPEKPTLKLGDICARLAPLSITADGLVELGFPHAATDRAAKLYRESDWPAICEALIQHITQVPTKQFRSHLGSTRSVVSASTRPKDGAGLKTERIQPDNHPGDHHA